MPAPRNPTKRVSTRRKTVAGTARSAGRTRTAVTRIADLATAGLATVVRAVVAEKRVTTAGVAANPMASRSVCQTTTPFAAGPRVSPTVTPAAEATAVPASAV